MSDGQENLGLDPAEVFAQINACPKTGQVICHLGPIAHIAMRALGPGRLLPLLGSLGMVLPLSLGVALGRTGRVTAVEGDGGLLMCLGSLSTIASQAPPNLLCIILDNNGYRTTGGQPTTLEPGGGIERLLIASGFTNVRTVSSLVDLEAALSWGCQPGLRAIVCLTRDPVYVPPAPTCDPRSLAREFKRFKCLDD